VRQHRHESQSGEPPACEASVNGGPEKRSSGGQRAAGRSWARKFASAGRGIGRAFWRESSFRVHLPAAAGVAAAGAFFRIEPAEWAVVAMAIGGVIAAELFNSAIEQLARGPGTRRHPRLRDALDIASGGVLVAATAAAIAGLVIFLPRLLPLLAALSSHRG
jgi:diacylglycerol kinase